MRHCILLYVLFIGLIASHCYYSSITSLHASGHEAKTQSVFRALRAKHVISYDLHDALPQYTQGILENAVLAALIYPEWTVRLYHDNTAPLDILHVLSFLYSSYVELVDVTHNALHSKGMGWRLLVTVDPTVDRYIIRDCDGRLDWSERRAVDDWIASNKSFHVIRNHHHDKQMPSGKWGGVRGALPNIRRWMEEDNQRRDIDSVANDPYELGLIFLYRHVWPIAKHDVFISNAK